MCWNLSNASPTADVPEFYKRQCVCCQTRRRVKRPFNHSSGDGEGGGASDLKKKEKRNGIVSLDFVAMAARSRNDSVSTMRRE